MKVLIIGITGSLAPSVRQSLAEETDYHFTSFVRSADRLKYQAYLNEAIEARDVMDTERLTEVIQGHNAIIVLVTR